MSHVLDNPVWQALTAPLSPIESSDPVALADLAKGLPVSTEVRVLCLSAEPLPPVLWRKPITVQA